MLEAQTWIVIAIFAVLILPVVFSVGRNLNYKRKHRR